MDFEKIKTKFFSQSKENGINQQCIGKDNNKDERLINKIYDIRQY